MSMRPRALPEVPEQTAAVAKAAFRKGTLAMRVRDELGEVFGDGAFIDAFGIRGKPGISPGQLAMVTVLQFAENLTDRQAADAVRGRIDWKYCLGLELTDPGFDFSVLSQFRTRLVAHDLQGMAFEMLLDRLVELGLVKARGRQRTDRRMSWPRCGTSTASRWSVRPCGRRWKPWPRRHRSGWPARSTPRGHRETGRRE